MVTGAGRLGLGHVLGVGSLSWEHMIVAYCQGRAN